MTEVVKNHPLYGDISVISEDRGICCHIKNNIVWEQHILDVLTKIMKDRPGTFIDAGSFIGPHSIGISKLVPNTKIVAFEPTKQAFKCLQENAKRTFNIEVHNIALSNVNSKGMMIYNNDGNPGGCFLKNDNEKSQRLHGNTEMNTIDIKTIDSFNIEDVTLIKIDTEGQEKNVILGAVDTIKKYKPAMVVEIQGGCTYSSATPEQKQNIDECINLIKSLNYKVELIHFHDYLCTPL